MAAVSEAPPTTVGTRNDAARKYPPLLAIFIAMAIVLAVLPSALNLPQSNPTQTLEYAPVPPDDQDAPPNSNMSSLGLGSSSGIDGAGARGGDGAGGDPLEIPPPNGPPQKPSGDYQCVGENPKRQTIDPLAPPCVPFFDGDNGGSTYQGVTAKEITLLIYLDGGISYTQASDPTRRATPEQEYFDLFKPEDPKRPEHLTTRGLRTWQQYFNQRFQTYDRTVHFHVYYSKSQPSSDDRRADAADNFEKVKPFAVVSFATEGFEDEYLKAMARKGVLNFGSFGLRPSEFFEAFPKMIWSYLPSIEQQTRSFVNYICTKIGYAGALATNAGGELQNRPRKFGIIHTKDPKQQGLVKAAEIVMGKLNDQCGVKMDHVGIYPTCCLAQDNGEVPTYAAQQMQEMSDKDITTIIWPGGINGNYGKAAKANNYFPEWIVMGDGLLDAWYAIILAEMSASFDRRAIVVTPQTLKPADEQQLCWREYRDVDRATPDYDLKYICEFYENLLQFFIGVQVAGPKLGPTSIDKGFHAIPQKRESNDPAVPACFYEPGDYTCIKDTEAMAWSANDRAPGSNYPGCWRAIEGGQRYLPGEWLQATAAPRDGFAKAYAPSDPCNGYSTSVRFNPT